MHFLRVLLPKMMIVSEHKSLKMVWQMYKISGKVRGNILGQKWEP